MGRHARAPEGAATRKITVRLPESVAAQWTAAAAEAGMTVSDWIRLRATGESSLPTGWVGRRPPRRRSGLGTAVPPTVDPAVVMQLARIGNNLNQIARRLNTTRGPLDIAGLAVLHGIAGEIDASLARGLPARSR